jgi:hypothetical protein
VVNEFPDRTVRSDTLSRSVRFELVQRPSASDPRTSFRSASEIEYVNKVEHVSEYVRRPRLGLTWALLGSSGLALWMSSDMRTRGFAKYTPIAYAAALTSVLSAGYLNFVLPQSRLRATRLETVSKRSSEPLDVDVSLIGRRWQRRLYTGSDCLARFELSSMLDSLPKGKDFGIAAHVLNMPEYACSVQVESEVVDSLIAERTRERQLIEREQRLREEEERRKREAVQDSLRAVEARRQAEVTAASRIWRSLTTTEQDVLNTCFSFATTDFQLVIIQVTELKTYGDFLALGPEKRIHLLRQIGRSLGEPTWSILLQRQLGIPAYLAEAILR